MAEYGYQTNPHQRAKLQGQARYASNTVGRGHKPGEYLVVGRVVNGVRLWDVYITRDDGGQSLIGRDFIHVMEAEEFIRDRRRGQITVAWKGALRGRFKNAGGLLVPARDISAPR